jgi:hypothetical protein
MLSFMVMPTSAVVYLFAGVGSCLRKAVEEEDPLEDQWLDVLGEEPFLGKCFCVQLHHLNL